MQVNNGFFEMHNTKIGSPVKVLSCQYLCIGVVGGKAISA
jgi:hypothetical protein